jgi:hypothetical protein
LTDISIPCTRSAGQATGSGPSLIDTLRATLELFIPASAVCEVRVLGAPRTSVVSGYFTDPLIAAQAASEWDGRAEAIYITLNPVLPTVMSRAANHLKPYAKHTTTDAEIARRRWLLLDADPQRPAGVSATDDEHAAALAWCQRVRAALAEEGWPAPIEADSGNGAHLLYPLDLPNDDASRTLIQRLLVALAARFDDPPGATPRIRLDTTVHNAARITKLYGTLVRKGDHTPERPHRRSALLAVPEGLREVGVGEEGRAS